MTPAGKLPYASHFHPQTSAHAPLHLRGDLRASLQLLTCTIVHRGPPRGCYTSLLKGGVIYRKMRTTCACACIVTLGSCFMCHVSSVATNLMCMCMYRDSGSCFMCHVSSVVWSANIPEPVYPSPPTGILMYPTQRIYPLLSPTPTCGRHDTKNLSPGVLTK